VNSRLDELQAAVLLVKLRYLDAENAMRRQIASRYNQHIENNKLILPALPTSEQNHVWHLYVLRTDEREVFISHMNKRSVGTLIHYPIPPYHQKAYPQWKDRSYPISEMIHRTIISIPLSTGMTDEQIDTVIEACNSYWI
jgi:dTDP-4-amino-4,6-dideoxygalactose transaminase